MLSPIVLFVGICYLWGVVHAKLFTEQILAQDLIGSHFGVPGTPSSFDYVVLGGGTGGISLATRLAQSGRYSVAIVEAGDFYEFTNGNLSEIPADASAFIDPSTRNPLLDWYQFTENQTGLGGRSLFFPSGKVLGGSSARNFMWYHRSSKGAYQKWADLTGDDGYKFQNFLPYFQKSAQYHPPDNIMRRANSTPSIDMSAWSPSGGPLQVGYPNWANPISSWISQGLSAMGLKELPGLVNGDIFGWAYTAFTIDPSTQTRSSSEASYLRAALRTTGIVVYKNTMAKKVIFDADKRAVGAIISTGGLSFQINATREVIVSAGALRSPQLLMVSGVGPRDILSKLGIPVIKDLPGVGQNMWDHIAFSPAYAVNLVTHSSLSDASWSAQQTADYISSRTGQLTNCGGDILGMSIVHTKMNALPDKTSGFAKLPTGSISNKTRAELDAFSSDWPDYEHLFLDASFGGTPNDNRQYVSSSAALTTPFSRGNVTIISNDTEVHPIVSPNWLLDPRDQEVALAAFKQARAVFTNNSGTSGIVLGTEVFPGLDVSTDSQILDTIKQSAAPSYHASSTCRMGLLNDTMAVLDSKARVYGVKGLRVVDASAFPVLPPGHPSSLIYALAEKIADAIINEE
ncbi:hypothetical protein HYFRA_00004247 [Hymenoscyphus fraxineus]|uniref:Glucose-methanol-choline oxidoreductase N-terminal domain-containing protein n=1 Tax=Hymenoscyphus fraxineus TaxID=746836 RepID=A0A9N9KQU6_9HELO|nr:hypothetical protein HYFRA_00004247 [Hymenoscyphus fraxineus]